VVAARFARNYCLAYPRNGDISDKCGEGSAQSWQYQISWTTTLLGTRQLTLMEAPLNWKYNSTTADLRIYLMCINIAALIALSNVMPKAAILTANPN
jgi:hypothetical protein